MKKFLGFLLILSLIVVFVGCSNNTSSTSDNTASNVSSSDASASIKMGRAEYAAHGTKCFTVAVVAMQGDKIVGASIDDYQYMDKSVAKGVPNSDKVAEGDFGTFVKDPKMVLASKKTNTKYYSEHMKEAAKATTPLDQSYAAIEAFVTGKTVAELEDVLSKNSKEKMVDVVSGATLADTKGYVTAIVEAAKAAK